MNLNFDQIKYFFLLLIIPLFYFIYQAHNQWKISVQKQFSDKKFRNILFFKINSNRRFVWYLILILLIILTLVDIVADSKKIIVKNKFIEIVFALDISNSMNARDIPPSRLENGKKIIEKIIQEKPQNKMGLIVFAGHSHTLLPLTDDTHALKMVLLSINSEIIDYQGTNINNAIKESCKLFNQNNKSGKIIILISDGEDHFINKNSGINLAKKSNIQIISVGVGTERGTIIPNYDKQKQLEYIIDNNENIVITKLNKNNLKKISIKTSGFYTNHYSQSKTLKFINKSINSINNYSIKKNTNEVSKHYFQWLIACTLIIFFLISLTNFDNEFNI